MHLLMGQLLPYGLISIGGVGEPSSYSTKSPWAPDSTLLVSARRMPGYLLFFLLRDEGAFLWSLFLAEVCLFAIPATRMAMPDEICEPTLGLITMDST